MRYKWCRSKISNKHRKLFSALLALLVLIIFSASGSAQTIMGDVNGDGRIDVRDVTLVQKHVLRLGLLTEQRSVVADVNGDGDINIRDVILIMQRSIGKINSFPLQVTKIDEITNTVSLGTSQADIGLPSTVKVTINDQVKRDISVNWETTATPAYNPNVSGAYVFMGNLVNLPIGIDNPNAIKAKATVLIITGPMPPTPVTSPPFTTSTANNAVSITLSGGTFKAGTITAADFTFAGTNQVALEGGTFTRTSNTVVTITGLRLAAATDNTVTVKAAAAMATQASSVAAVASTTILPIWPVEMEGPPTIVSTFFDYEVTVTIKDEFKEQVCAVTVLRVSATKMPYNKRWRVYLPGPITIDGLVDNIVIERCF